MSKVRGRGAACTGLLEGGRGELTLSCSYRSVGRGSMVKCQRSEGGEPLLIPVYWAGRGEN
jgi:hypothetical protein